MPVCVQYLQELSAIHRTFAEKGLAILGVTPESPVDQVLGARASVARWNGIPYPLLTVERDVDAKPASWLAGAPMTLLLDRTGIVRKVHAGYRTAAELEPDIRALLEEQPPSAAESGNAGGD